MNDSPMKSVHTMLPLESPGDSQSNR